ncbi:unnamed protein product [Acanthoscelides obtectus]|uniref:Uncharacterized protein n=1 Tax=Acanthoscelides obtectus TaxID=200917 RepID=A0A9P0MA05_ACAOB|nr:unnamed protein product [Acanthoscelides obtectus]CAK1622488.1 hypothetical protein AOBTE_LOCUS1516 [Acanthoscelides obtectus]
MSSYPILIRRSILTTSFFSICLWHLHSRKEYRHILRN